MPHYVYLLCSGVWKRRTIRKIISTWGMVKRKKEGRGDLNDLNDLTDLKPCIVSECALEFSSSVFSGGIIVNTRSSTGHC